ncbi:tetratricopeptide repeat protein [Hydrogenimonas sp.]
MDALLLDYRDPLFAVLLIAGMVFVIAFVSYWWGVYVKTRKSRRLQRFLRRFETHGVRKSLESMPFSPEMTQPLVLLARAYEKSGEYNHAIEIGLYLLEHVEEEATVYELMELVGTTYMHAGFLERAQRTFMQILKSNPRNQRVLNDLMVVYERLQRYDKAAEVVESLEALGVETGELRRYVALKRLLQDPSLDEGERARRVVDFYKKKRAHGRIVFEYLLRHAPHLAWGMVEDGDAARMADIFWYLPTSFLDIDRIKALPRLKALFGARGDIEPAESVGWFLVDLLNHLRQTGYREATLQFAYLCERCKQQFPVPFERCPKCLALESVRVETELTKANDETGYHLL